MESIDDKQMQSLKVSEITLTFLRKVRLTTLGRFRVSEKNMLRTFSRNSYEPVPLQWGQDYQSSLQRPGKRGGRRGPLPRLSLHQLTSNSRVCHTERHILGVSTQLCDIFYLRPVFSMDFVKYSKLAGLATFNRSQFEMKINYLHSRNQQALL